MQYTNLGRSGLSVSRLCLGTMNFGPQTPEADAHRIMDAAHDNGINFFDTANIYGWKTGEGVTENILGRWFASGGGRRERTVLATKVYGSMGDWPNEGRLSALHIRRACDESLRRLQTDHIDVYQMHHVDRSTPVDEIWEAMTVLREQGKIIYVGSSNFAGWHIAQAQETARRRQHGGLVSEQSKYNLLTRDVEREVIPACLEYGVGLVPWSPLQGGLLGGVTAKDGSRSRRLNDDARVELLKHHEVLGRWEALCEEIGHPPAHVALAWLLSRPAVSAPIIGPRTVEQLLDSLSVVHVDLEGDVLERIDSLFPPQKPAPEDYAW